MAKRAVEWARWPNGRGMLVTRIGDVTASVKPVRGLPGGKAITGYSWKAFRSGAEVKGYVGSAHADALAQAQADALRAVPAVRRAGAILCAYLGAAQ